MKFKLLKDLPDLKAGAMSEPVIDKKVVFNAELTLVVCRLRLMYEAPDWFEEVKELDELERKD